MRKTNKRNKHKYSKKTRKNRNFCEKGVTDEVIRIRRYTNYLKKLNKSNKSKNNQSKNNQTKN